MKILYTLSQIGALVLFVVLAFLRLIEPESNFAMSVSIATIPISLLIMLYTARTKIINSDELWDGKHEHRKNFLELSMVVLVILSIVYITVLIFFDGINTTLADFSTILALGISLSNDLLSNWVSNILHLSFAEREAVSK